MKVCIKRNLDVVLIFFSSLIIIISIDFILFFNAKFLILFTILGFYKKLIIFTDITDY